MLYETEPLKPAEINGAALNRLCHRAHSRQSRHGVCRMMTPLAQVISGTFTNLSSGIITLARMLSQAASMARLDFSP
jgi:hypothetical protein